MRFLKRIKNRTATLDSYNKRNVVSFGFPTRINIESTNICNLDCPMCPRGGMIRKTGTMSFSLFKKIIDDVKEYAELVALHFMGEPLFNPQIFKMISYAKESGVHAYLSTNATVLNEKSAKSLIESGLDFIIFSFDGTDKNMYERMRKNANYETTLKNIVSFLELRKNLSSLKPYTILQMIKMNVSETDVNSYYNRFKNLPVDSIMFRPIHTWGGVLEENSIFNQDRCPSANNKYSHPCYWLWDRMYIYWDGKVVPCCFDYDGSYIVGDLSRSTVSEVWNGKKMQEIRKKHLMGNYQEVSLCQKCFPRTPNSSSLLYQITHPVLFQEFQCYKGNEANYFQNNILKRNLTKYFEYFRLFK